MLSILLQKIFYAQHFDLSTQAWSEHSSLGCLRKLWLYFPNNPPLQLAWIYGPFNMKKYAYPPDLTCKGMVHCDKIFDADSSMNYIYRKRVIYHRYLEFVAHSDWGIWCDGWMAFTLWDPRKQWKSVRMRKITSICHNLDRQADRQGRQETQYVSQSTYTQTQRDLGALLTCPITQTGSGKGTICAHMCEYLTYSTTPPPSFAAEIEACSMTLMITSTLCLP